MAEAIFDPTRVSTKAEFSVFTQALHEGVKGYMYVEADGAISVGAVCLIDTDGTADEGTGTLAATHSGCPVGVAQTAIPDNSYGWLQRSGPCAAIQSDGVLTVGETIWFGTTAGGISDTNTADAQIYGLKANAIAAAGNTTGFLDNPTVQGDV